MSSKTIIVGIAGYKESGKDTAALLIADRFHGFEFRRLGFADEGKEEVATIVGSSVAFLNSNKKHPLVRHIFQWYLGEYAKKEHGNDIWLQRLSVRINELPPLTDNRSRLIIITDVRFPNEATWIKELGGYLILIERFDSTTDTHPSEISINQIKGIDIRLPNKGTLLDLRRECLWVSQYIKERYNV